MSRIVEHLLHALVRRLQKVRRFVWFFTTPHTSGAHAIPLTREGKVVLVTLSYARGWRLPGGGMKKREEAEDAVLRELREEIGMTSHGTIEKVMTFSHRPDYRQDRSSLFVVRDVVYRAGWSLEVKAVREFERDKLPADTAAITRRLLAAAASVL